ncbi:hypothetical protein [Streptomyces sp. NPDC020298]|uniref:hypothetical protein n=1 Tax=unclassified Streptomyces TaxID=2593676 RepID=UPI0033D24475
MPGEGFLPPHRARKVSSLPRDLYDIQSESRTEQKTQEWPDKAHVQQILTAIAVNLERISSHLRPAPEQQPRPPTARQGFLDRLHIPRPRSWCFATHPAG